MVHMNNIALLVVLKMPGVLADALSALVIYRMVRYFTSERIAMVSAGVYLFNPGIIFDSAIWGQVDSVGACLALLATFLLIRGSIATSVAVFTASLLVKPQFAPLAPMLGVFLVRRFVTQSANSVPPWRLLWDAVAAAVLAGVTMITVAIIPFELSWFGFARLVHRSVGWSPFGSVNAFNLWGAVQGNSHAGAPCGGLGWAAPSAQPPRLDGCPLETPGCSNVATCLGYGSGRELPLPHASS